MRYLAGDIKPRNICLVGGVWVLIDLDACRNIGEQQQDVKYSEGYMPCEGMAHLLEHGNLDTLVSSELHDIW